MKANSLHDGRASRGNKPHRAVRCTHLMVVVFLVLAQGAVLPAEPVSVLLQKGIFAEETEGDLDAAMAIYQQIVTQAKENQPLVAQAQYRLAVCHLKKGARDQAVALLTGLLKDLPDDAAFAGQVRAKLVELGVDLPTAAPELLKLPNAHRWEDISPNGRYAAFIEPYPDCSLVIDDLVSGQTWRIRNPKENPGRWGPLLFSPDGTRVAYFWFGGVEGENCIRFVSVGQTNVTDLARTKGNVWPLDWTPDGSRLLGLEVTGEFEKAEVILISTKDGTREIVPTGYDSKQIMDLSLAKFCKDGRYVVYPQGNGIGVFDLQNREHHNLIAHPGLSKLEGRIPGSSTFLFAGARGIKWAFYAFDVVDGEVKGEPREVMDHKDREFFAATQDGSVYYRVRHSSRTIHVASVDFQTGKLLEATHVVGWPAETTKSSPVWAWDGKSLAWESEGKTLIIQDLTSRTHRGFTWAGKLRGPAIYPYRSWSPDGKTFLVLSFPVEGSPGIHSIDCETGDIQPVVTRKWSGGDGAWVGQPQFSKDGRSVIFFRRIFGKDAPYTMQGVRFTDHIMRRDLKTSEEQEVYQPKGMLNTSCAFAISPDETRLALVMMETEDDYHLDVVDLRPDNLRRLYDCSIRGGGPLSSLSWTPNGEKLVFLRYFSHAEENQALLSIDATSGEVTPIDLGMKGIRHVGLHPDGRQVVFGVGHDETETFRERPKPHR